jgi:hypothetical protein
MIDCSTQNRLSKKECKQACFGFNRPCVWEIAIQPSYKLSSGAKPGCLQWSNPAIQTKKQESRSSKIRFFQQDFVSKAGKSDQGVYWSCYGCSFKLLLLQQQIVVLLEFVLHSVLLGVLW